ncbi:hypothetical protein BaRGS_00033252 [Batillaria attramentaria]|uniref:Uncharacterized protein n=1 Tax=Batillaria attramentaria TaxID=370345 RepID=A0ABD0JKV6_9CAEN
MTPEGGRLTIRDCDRPVSSITTPPSLPQTSFPPPPLSPPISPVQNQNPNPITHRHIAVRRMHLTPRDSGGMVGRQRRIVGRISARDPVSERGRLEYERIVGRRAERVG